MPHTLRGLLGFYSTWIGKAVFYVLIGVLLLIPFSNRVKIKKDKTYIFFIFVSIYVFVLAAFLFVLGVLSALNIRTYSSSSIITKDSSSKKTTTTTTTTKTTTLNETLVDNED